MRIKEKDIFIINEYQKKPDFSIRKLSRSIGVTKDSIFRRVKKLKKEIGLHYDYWLDFSKIGLKRMLILIQTNYEKLKNAFMSLVNPYILKTFLCLGGENLYLLAEYAIPSRFSMRNVLGLAKSWNWHLEQYQFYTFETGYKFSFHYYDTNFKEWNVNWLYWGLIIKDVLIKQKILDVYPFYNRWISDSTHIKLTISKGDLLFLSKFLNEFNSPAYLISKKLGISLMDFYYKKKKMVNQRVLKKFLKVTPEKLNLTEKLIVIIKTSDELVLD
ncbi:MAG: hypothetical protein ACTSYR_00425, partial [Candidatus Odinarchaeia archaeon]